MFFERPMGIVFCFIIIMGLTVHLFAGILISLSKDHYQYHMERWEFALRNNVFSWWPILLLQWIGLP